jgi:hypothetical protein
MIESDGSIVKFSVDQVDGPSGSVLYPTMEAAQLALEWKRSSGGSWEINRVVIFETTTGTICA